MHLPPTSSYVDVWSCLESIPQTQLQAQQQAPGSQVYRRLEVMPEGEGCRLSLLVKDENGDHAFESILEGAEFNLLRRLMDYSIPRLTGFAQTLENVRVAEPEQTVGAAFSNSGQNNFRPATYQN